MNRRYIPALRGRFGEWVYYSCLMPLRDLAQYVNFADELHKNKRLSDMIQRALKKGRGKEISTYLVSQPERFFNSLVVAVYGGDPSWHEISTLKPKGPDIRIDDIPPASRHRLGFLSFSGEEKLFALDGQHRLAGIKQSVGRKRGLADELCSVVLVAHKNTPEGFRRTRRLFTTLNKTARPVSKGDIIALDEDDAAAICTRSLVEDHKHFQGDRILYKANNNLPANDGKSLTTIGALYDAITIALEIKASKDKEPVPPFRPRDSRLKEYFRYTSQYFGLLAKSFRPLREYFEESDHARVVKNYRGRFGGHIMFRPVGLKIISEVIEQVSRKRSLKSSIQRASRLPQFLSELPYRDVLWDASRRKIMNKGAVLTRRLLLYQLRIEQDVRKLAKDYAKHLGRQGNGLTLLQRLRRV